MLQSRRSLATGVRDVLGAREAAATLDAKVTETAFEAFLRGRERDMFGYLRRLTGDEQAAYDLSQETFLRAWQHFPKISRYERPDAWLFRGATNHALNHL